MKLTINAVMLVVCLALSGCGCCDWLHRGDACCPQPACCPDPCGGYPSTGGCSNCAPGGGTYIDGSTTPIPQTLPGDTYIGPQTRPGPGGA